MLYTAFSSCHLMLQCKWSYPLILDDHTNQLICSRFSSRQHLIFFIRCNLWLLQKENLLITAVLGSLHDFLRNHLSRWTNLKTVQSSVTLAAWRYPWRYWSASALRLVLTIDGTYKKDRSKWTNREKKKHILNIFIAFGGVGYHQSR